MRRLEGIDPEYINSRFGLWPTEQSQKAFESAHRFASTEQFNAGGQISTFFLFAGIVETNPDIHATIGQKTVTNMLQNGTMFEAMSSDEYWGDGVFTFQATEAGLLAARRARLSNSRELGVGHLLMGLSEMQRGYVHQLFQVNPAARAGVERASLLRSSIARTS